jgi:DNA-directed RNA polymerase specialized sigma24 family protein
VVRREAVGTVDPSDPSGPTGADDQEWLQAAFTRHRTHLRAVAYRMLGSPSDADDALQEVWLRPG